MTKRILGVFVLIMIACFGMKASAGQLQLNCETKYGDQTFEKHRPSEAFSDLLLALATRPGVTDPDVIRSLEPAARKAGRKFYTALKRNYPSRSIRKFSLDILESTEQFVRAYQVATEEENALGIRVQATDDYYKNLLSAAENADIYLDDFVLDFLGAGAQFEKIMPDDSLSLTDRELIDLLLQNAVFNIQVNTFFRSFPEALDIIEYDPIDKWANGWSSLLLVKTDHLDANLHDLEELLSDSVTLADIPALMNYQYNQEARADLLVTTTAMELYFSGYGVDLTTLAEAMDSVGGVMSGMSTDILKGSGVFEYFSCADNPFCDEGWFNVPVPELAIYSWIKPEMMVRYRSVHRLPMALDQRGLEVPDRPDFSLFDTPFLPFFQMEYDMDLCDDLFTDEKKELEYAAADLEMRPLNMQERYALSKADTARRSKVLKRLKGLGAEERRAIGRLLKPFYTY